MALSHHINTYLEIESSEDRSLIVESFADDVVMLYHGRVMQKFRVAFEVADVAADATIDVTVNHFCKLIEALPIAARKLRIAFRQRISILGIRPASSRGVTVPRFNPTRLNVSPRSARVFG